MASDLCPLLAHLPGNPLLGTPPPNVVPTSQHKQTHLLPGDPNLFFALSSLPVGRALTSPTPKPGDVILLDHAALLASPAVIPKSHSSDFPDVSGVWTPMSSQIWPTEPWPGPPGNPLYPLNIKECIFDCDVTLLKTPLKLAFSWDAKAIQEAALDMPAASAPPPPPACPPGGISLQPSSLQLPICAPPLPSLLPPSSLDRN